MHNIEQYKTRLEDELKKVNTELNSVATQNAESGDWVALPSTEEMSNADENVSADVNEEWAERRAIVGELEIRYRNIIRALQKIESGDFGICEISRKPIEEERLNVNPAARTNLANLDREKDLAL